MHHQCDVILSHSHIKKEKETGGINFSHIKETFCKYFHWKV
jgi:hypothetical protein